MNKATAILYFAKNPFADDKMQRFPRFLAPAFRGAFGILHQQTAALLQQTGLPVFHSHEGNQNGSDFGRRITSAVEEVLEAGFRSVLVVGNDIPDLSKQDLESAIFSLNAGNNVLGPSTDGGAYLIGIQKTAFDAQNWIDLPWCTTLLFQSLLDDLSTDGVSPPHILRYLSDLDHSESIRHWLKHSAHKSAYRLRSFLRILISFAPVEFIFKDPPFISLRIGSTKSLRAPPVFL